MKLISWNIARRAEAWRALARTDADVALLQEATAPPLDVSKTFQFDPGAWQTHGAGCRRDWRAVVARLSDRVAVDWIETVPLAEAGPNQLGVSRLGTLAAARVADVAIGEVLTVVSLYGLWEKPHSTVGGSFIYADASVHRLISDLSALVGQRGGRGIVAAGDLNILFGYGEHGSRYWGGRYATVFDRMAAIGLTLVGPQAPRGRQADPWPVELPSDSRNVPTYFTTRQSPETATRQLDFVFASADLVERITVRAMNDPVHWGPSDHCQLEIEVRPGSA